MACRTWATGNERILRARRSLKAWPRTTTAAKRRPKRAGSRTPAAGWTVVRRGEIGRTGSIGRTGVTGVTGRIGVTGRTGSIGVTGSTGSTGPVATSIPNEKVWLAQLMSGEVPRKLGKAARGASATSGVRRGETRTESESSPPGSRPRGRTVQTIVCFMADLRGPRRRRRRSTRPTRRGRGRPGRCGRWRSPRTRAGPRR
ncbi:MAG: hypothetical protein IPO88_20280 [Nannocystis sp.]|nr:hypothetical protein [Nannocystis sp.]